MIYCYCKTLDGVAKIIHQQLSDVTETLNNLKAESKPIKESEALPELKVATKSISEPEVAAAINPVKPATTSETFESLKTGTLLVNIIEPNQNHSKPSKKGKKSKKNADQIVKHTGSSVIGSAEMFESVKVAEPVSVMLNFFSATDLKISR